MATWETRLHPDTTVTCYTRAATLVAPIDDTITRLQEYDREGVIAELSVETWPAEVPFTAHEEEPEAITAYRRFKTWANREGVSMRPAFGFRNRTTLVSDTVETVLRLPMCCLAVTIDGRLELVAPHQTDETTVTVDDCLSLLAAAARTTGGRSPRRPPTSTPPLNRCPACAGPLESGQGLYACLACSWHGIVQATPQVDTTTDDAKDTPDPASAPAPGSTDATGGPPEPRP